jgi:hypothetical protein
MRRRFPADRSRAAGSRACSGHDGTATRGYAGVTQLVSRRGASAAIADDIDDFEALAEGGAPGRGGTRDRAGFQPAVRGRLRFVRRQ